MLVDEYYSEQFDGLIENIKKIYHASLDRNKRLCEENDYLKSENYKDKELSEMKADKEFAEESMRHGFPIYEDEVKAIHDWIVYHENEKHGGYPCYRGVSGGGITYEFHPTAIGTTGIVRCSCGEGFVFREL